MAENFDWDPFKIPEQPFVKFTEEGDQIVGTIVNIRAHTFDPEKGPVPLIDIAPLDGSEQMTLSVDKVDLQQQISAIAPQAGDKLAVKLIGFQKAGGGNKKLFAIRHQRAEPIATSAGAPDWNQAADAPTIQYSEEPF